VNIIKFNSYFVYMIYICIIHRYALCKALPIVVNYWRHKVCDPNSYFRVHEHFRLFRAVSAGGEGGEAEEEDGGEGQHLYDFLHVLLYENRCVMSRSKF